MSISFENLLMIHPDGVTSKKDKGLLMIDFNINLCTLLDP